MKNKIQIAIIITGLIVGIAGLTGCEKPGESCDGCKGEIITIVMERDAFGGGFREAFRENEGIGCMDKSRDDQVIEDYFDSSGRYVVRFYNCQGSTFQIN